MTRHDLLLLFLLSIQKISADPCTSIPGYFDCGHAACCTSAVPDSCPPAALAEANTGSIVCSSDCDDRTETCSGDGWSEAISVANDGSSTVLEPFKTGKRNQQGSCWFWITAGCIGDETCGFEYGLTVRRLNDEDHSNPVVRLLNDAVSSLLTITLVELGDSGLLYWRYAISTDKVQKIIDDNKNELTTADLNALSQGGEFLMTWGYEVTAFNIISAPISTSVSPYRDSGSGDACWYLTNGTSWSDARPFSYENKTMLFTDCVYNCNAALSLVRPSWIATASTVVVASLLAVF